MNPTIGLLFALLLPCTTAVAQTKKDVITSQQTTLDSIFSIADQQHALILKADQRLREQESEIEDLNIQRRLLLDHVDSLVIVSSVLHQKVSGLNMRVRGRPVDTSDPLKGILFRRTVLSHFSSGRRRDRFELEAEGSDLTTAVYWFRIRTAEGRVLYESEVQFILMEEMAWDNERLECKVTQRLDAFFGEERFRVLEPTSGTNSGEQGRSERTHFIMPDVLFSTWGPLPTAVAFLLELKPNGTQKALFIERSGELHEVKIN